MDLAPVREVIKRRCGLVIDPTAAGKLEAGVGARMRRLGVTSIAQYVDCIVRDPAQFDDLVNFLTINETYFFREPAHLELLTKRIVPDTLRAKLPGQRLRILSAGCSTGEEPYSLVIALTESFGPGIFARVDVMGADIDSDVIERARAGVFHPHSFRGRDDTLRARYFEEAGSGRRRVKDAVRRHVTFHRLNLLSDTYPAGLHGVDVIFYRNVSIYFEPATRRTVFGQLAALLNDPGHMFVGTTETLSHDVGVLTLTEADGVFFFQKDGSLERRRSTPGRLDVTDGRPQARGGRETAGAARAATLRRVPSTENDEPRRLWETATSLARGERYDEALSQLDLLLERSPSYVAAYPLRAHLLMQTGRADEAERVCLAGLEKDPWSLDLRLFLGLIARSRGDDEASLRWFKEAVYIRSSCGVAHFYLGEIHRAAGEPDKASREYDIAARLMQKTPVRESDVGVFPLPAPVDQMIRLCSRHATELARKLR